jgi:hypothetical protein
MMNASLAQSYLIKAEKRLKALDQLNITQTKTFDPSAFRRLKKAEENYFWFQVRRKWIFDRIRRFISPPAKVLEIKTIALTSSVSLMWLSTFRMILHYLSMVSNKYPYTSLLVIPPRPPLVKGG